MCFLMAFMASGVRHILSPQTEMPPATSGGFGRSASIGRSGVANGLKLLAPGKAAQPLRSTSASATAEHTPSILSRLIRRSPFVYAGFLGVRLTFEIRQPRASLGVYPRLAVSEVNPGCILPLDALGPGSPCVGAGGLAPEKLDPYPESSRGERACGRQDSLEPENFQHGYASASPSLLLNIESAM